MNTSASIGIALTDSRWQAAEDVLRCADTAMYHAKRGGKSRAAMFEPGMSDDVLDRIEMEADLRRAILQGDLRVHYQPIVGIESRRIVEVEALCRWTHPKYGEISPDKFIPLAEESGLILTLGKWVLEQACLEHRRWVREFGEADAPICCVNVSLRQIQDDRFVSQVLATLGDTGMDPRSLKLEITEGVFAKDAELTGSRLADLRETGIKFAIDDFGSGYSSLGFLAKLPVNTIKIDRLFTSRIGQGAADDAIIRAIVSLASALKVDVTAEGIETDAQLGVLKALACDRGQGFMISKAVTADAFLKLLREQNLHRD